MRLKSIVYCFNRREDGDIDLIAISAGFPNVSIYLGSNDPGTIMREKEIWIDIYVCKSEIDKTEARILLGCFVTGDRNLNLIESEV